MNKLICAALLAALPGAASAADAADWKSTGELGLAFTRGNSESDTVNAKLDFSKEDERWLYNANAAFLRAKGEVVIANVNGTVTREKVSNANRYALGGKVGYKFTDRMYFFGSARYDNDDFAPYTWQFVGSAGIGYAFIKNERTELSGEIGPGWRRFQPIDVLVAAPPPPRLVTPDKESDVVLRAGANFKHKLTDTTTVSNVTVVESGGGNTFLQNDLGLQVQMSESLALKTGLQTRHTSDVPPGVKKTDTLLTTNIVVAF
jgi:putative salt-induced outer membrane protein